VTKGGIEVGDVMEHGRGKDEVEASSNVERVGEQVVNVGSRTTLSGKVDHRSADVCRNDALEVIGEQDGVSTRPAPEVDCRRAAGRQHRQQPVFERVAFKRRVALPMLHETVVGLWAIEGHQPGLWQFLTANDSVPACAYQRGAHSAINER